MKLYDKMKKQVVANNAEEYLTFYFAKLIIGTVPTFKKLTHFFSSFRDPKNGGMGGRKG